MFWLFHIQRDRKRKGWIERCCDKQYRRLPVNERPVPPPLIFSQQDSADTTNNVETGLRDNRQLLVSSPLCDNLENYVRDLIRLKEQFIQKV